MKYMNRKTAMALFSSVALLGLSGCGGTDGVPSDTQLVGSIGKLPVAVANTNPEKIRCAQNTKTPNLELNGTKSFDPDGEIISYIWYITNNGTDYAFIGDGAVHTIEDPCVKIENKAGEYSIKLSVEDNDGNVNSDIVDVIAVENKLPVAEAGPNQSVDYNGSITLDGSHSDDPDGHIVKYSWNYMGVVKTGVIVTYDNLITEGENTITLTVTDNDGATANDSVVVTVSNTEPENTPVVTVSNTEPENTPPVADAGENQILGICETLTLDGSESSDPDGTITNYEWFVWSDGERHHIDYGQTVQLPPSVNRTTANEHVFTLQVTDNNGAVAEDNVTITVASEDDDYDYTYIVKDPVDNPDSIATGTSAVISENLDFSSYPTPGYQNNAWITAGNVQAGTVNMHFSFTGNVSIAHLDTSVYAERTLVSGQSRYGITTLNASSEDNTVWEELAKADATNTTPNVPVVERYNNTLPESILNTSGINIKVDLFHNISNSGVANSRFLNYRKGSNTTTFKLNVCYEEEKTTCEIDSDCETGEFCSSVGMCTPET